MLTVDRNKNCFNFTDKSQVFTVNDTVCFTYVETKKSGSKNFQELKRIEIEPYLVLKVNNLICSNIIKIKIFVIIALIII